MSFFFKDLLTGQPQDADTIKVYAKGTTDLVAGLKKLDGTALANPFLVSDAGGVGEWGFEAPNQTDYDVWWEEGSVLISQAQREVDGSFFDFNTALADPAYKKGRSFWNMAKNALSYFNEITGVTVNLGQEVLFPVYNGTVSTILNGKFVTPDPTGIIHADAHHKHKSRLIAMATHDIPAGTWGYVTRLGQVGGLNTIGWTAGQIVYLGSDGGWSMTPPDDGGYSIIGAVVDVVHATAGVVTVDIHVPELTVEVTDTNGFPLDQRANTSLAVDALTRTFTIDVISGDHYHFYELGDKYEKEGGDTTQSIVFTDVEGEHWFFFEAGVLKAEHDPTFARKLEIITGYAFIGTIWWNATDNQVEVDIMEERHGISMAPATHVYLHLTQGAKHLDGMGLGDVIADANGSLDAHAQFSVAAGSYADEDLVHVSDALAVGATIPVIYNDGANSNIRTSTQAGFGILNAPAGRLYYNEDVGGVWQLTEVGNNDFTLYHIFGFNGVDVNIVSVMGQSTYGTKADARVGATTEISNLISGLPFPEMIPLATLIYECKDAYTNAVKARIVSDGDGNPFIDWRTSEISQGTPPSSHSNLTNVDNAATGIVQGHVDNTKPFQVPELTTTQRDLITPNAGMRIYNTTIGAEQAYLNGRWGLSLRDFDEPSEALTFVAGAGTLPVDTCANKQSMTLTEASAITTSGTPVAGKPITLTITHSGGAWTLSWNGTPLTILVGATGETERVLVEWNGTGYNFDSIGLVDQVI